MYSDLLVHVDTLGLRSDSALIGLGAIAFNLADPDVKPSTFYRAISAESNANRHCDLLSVDFWRQDPPYLDPFTRELTILPAAVEELVEFYQTKTQPKCTTWLWACTFEGAILQSVFEGLALVLPWPYYSARDAKTFCSVAAHYFDGDPAVTPHGDSPEDQMRRRVEALRDAHRTFLSGPRLISVA